MIGRLRVRMYRLAALLLQPVAAGVLCAQAGRIESFVWPLRSGSHAGLPKLTLLREPDVRIGSTAGDEHTLFNGISGVARLPTGRLAVGDAGNSRVVFFDSIGRFQKSIGRAGDGPAEFRQQRWTGLCSNGDVAVQDGAHGRLTFFSPAGDLRGSTSLPPDASFDRFLWCSGGANSLMLLDHGRGGVPVNGYLTIPTSVIRVGASSIDTILRPGIQEFFVSQRLHAFSAVPFGESVVGSAARRGAFVCATLEGRCWAIDTAGTTVRPIHLGLPRPNAESADWDLAVARQFDAEPSSRYRKRGKDVLTEVLPRSQFPRIDKIQADDAGNLWVRTFDNYRTEVATWVVYSARGAVIGLAATRRALQVVRIAEDYLIGFSRDADDVERVEVYRFNPFLRSPRR